MGALFGEFESFYNLGMVILHMFVKEAQKYKTELFLSSQTEK